MNIFTNIKLPWTNIHLAVKICRVAGFVNFHDFSTCSLHQLIKHFYFYISLYLIICKRTIFKKTVFSCRFCRWFLEKSLYGKKNLELAKKKDEIFSTFKKSKTFFHRQLRSVKRTFATAKFYLHKKCRQEINYWFHLSTYM